MQIERARKFIVVQSISVVCICVYVLNIVYMVLLCFKYIGLQSIVNRSKLIRLQMWNTLEIVLFFFR